MRLLIVKQILLVSTSGNVWRAVRRVWKLMIGCEGLRTHIHVINIFETYQTVCDQDCQQTTHRYESVSKYFPNKSMLL